MPAVTGRRDASPLRDADGLTSDQLREVALQLRRYAAQFARTEAEVTAFLDRSNDLQAETQMTKSRKPNACSRTVEADLMEES